MGTQNEFSFNPTQTLPPRRKMLTTRWRLTSLCVVCSLGSSVTVAMWGRKPLTRPPKARAKAQVGEVAPSPL